MADDARSTRYSVILTPDELDQLRVAAASARLTPPELIRAVIAGASQPGVGSALYDATAADAAGVRITGHRLVGMLFAALLPDGPCVEHATGRAGDVETR